MTNSALLPLLSAIALGTFLLRFSFIFLYGRMTLPQWIHRSMRFVPAAVLSALIFPALVIQNGAPVLSIGNHRLVAGLLALAVAWKTKNLLATTLVGLGIFWLLTYM
ncbi:AzlD domain-containing protein [Anoxynatronum buryatiense]|uniref:Branched-chain amino acid transport protein n=1 Tax=Anoxynatronum buryatiense TaxID=489973 RepID=A0AA45WU40_9CLOT|nr:AzlD domain-containing protein [Anoxynatronum buryatiense]SMP45758.1 Branched-chain amino acid transport protein [Anoxynatronum buryatiense]